MEEAMLTKLQESFSQLQQLTAYLDEVESQQKVKEENNTNQKNQTTTIEIIEDSAAPAPAPAPAPESKEPESKEPEEKVAAAAAAAAEDTEESPIAFLEANHLRCADLPFTIDEFKKAKPAADENAVTVNITSIPVALMDLKPAEVMTTAAAIVSSLIETQHPVLPGEAVRMKNEKSYVSIYRKSESEVLFTWISYPTEKEIAAAANQIQSQRQENPPPYTVLIEQGIQIASLIFKCTKSDDTELTFEFNSESVEGWSADISSAVTNMVGRFFSSKKRNQGGQLVGKKAYMNLTRMSDDEVLFTWITYPRV
jgi:uncharacterized protein YbaA (DUF1428 family)